MCRLPNDLLFKIILRISISKCQMMMNTFGIIPLLHCAMPSIEKGIENEQYGVLHLHATSIFNWTNIVGSEWKWPSPAASTLSHAQFYHIKRKISKNLSVGNFNTVKKRQFLHRTQIWVNICLFGSVAEATAYFRSCSHIHKFHLPTT